MHTQCYECGHLFQVIDVDGVMSERKLMNEVLEESREVNRLREALKKWEDGAAEILPTGSDASEPEVAKMFFDSFEEIKEELSAARLEAEAFRDNMRIHLTESDGKFSWENAKGMAAGAAVPPLKSD